MQKKNKQGWFMEEKRTCNFELHLLPIEKEEEEGRTGKDDEGDEEKRRKKEGKKLCVVNLIRSF